MEDGIGCLRCIKTSSIPNWMTSEELYRTSRSEQQAGRTTLAGGTESVRVTYATGHAFWRDARIAVTFTANTILNAHDYVVYYLKF